MTVLTIRPLRIRAAASLLKKGVLDSILQATCRVLAEAAACQAGEFSAREGRDPVILWTKFGKGESSQLRACRTAWDIVQRLTRQEARLARQHGVALCAHIGIASDGRDGAVGQGDGRVVDRAQVLRQANRLYGTTILVDGIVAAGAERRMALREVDRVGLGGHSLLRGPEAAAIAGITTAELSAFAPSPAGIHEVLGPQAVVPVGRRSAAVAFGGALDLYHAGEWSQAAVIFALLAGGTRPDPLAGFYLRKCRQHEGEARHLAAALASEAPGAEAPVAGRGARGEHAGGAVEPSSGALGSGVGGEEPRSPGSRES